MVKIWKNKAYPLVDLPFISSPSKGAPLRGRFVITGPPEEMIFLWDAVKEETNDANLGYFSNMSDDNNVIIVYHGNAINKIEKNRIEKKIRYLIRTKTMEGSGISIKYKTEEDTDFQSISADNPLNNYIDDSTQVSEYHSDEQSINTSDEEVEQILENLEALPPDDGQHSVVNIEVQEIDIREMSERALSAQLIGSYSDQHYDYKVVKIKLPLNDTPTKDNDRRVTRSMVGHKRASNERFQELIAKRLKF